MLTTQNSNPDPDHNLNDQNENPVPDKNPYPKPPAGTGPNRDNDDRFANPSGDPTLTKEDAKRIDDATAAQVARNYNINSKDHVNLKIADFCRDLRAQCALDSDGYKACQSVLDSIGNPVAPEAVKTQPLRGDKATQDKLLKEAQDRRDKARAKQAHRPNGQ